MKLKSNLMKMSLVLVLSLGQVNVWAVGDKIQLKNVIQTKLQELDKAIEGSNGEQEINLKIEIIRILAEFSKEANCESQDIQDMVFQAESAKGLQEVVFEAIDNLAGTKDHDKMKAQDVHERHEEQVDRVAASSSNGKKKKAEFNQLNEGPSHDSFQNQEDDEGKGKGKKKGFFKKFFGGKKKDKYEQI